MLVVLLDQGLGKCKCRLFWALAASHRAFGPWALIALLCRGLNFPRGGVAYVKVFVGSLGRCRASALGLKLRTFRALGFEGIESAAVKWFRV